MKYSLGLTAALSTLLLASCATETYPAPDPAVMQSCAETSDYDRTAAVAEADELVANSRTHNTALGFVITEGGVNPATHKRPSLQRPPQVSFPVCAMSRGIQGSCEIYFNVDAEGMPVKIIPVCTHRVFVREAERAFTRARFVPATVNGQAVEYQGVVQPISFKLEDSYNPASTDAATK